MQGIAQKVMAEPGKYSVQQLQQAVQNGVLPAYIGVPLIQEKLQQQKSTQGAVQPQPDDEPPLAEQVMAEADQAQGVDTLPTELPQQYAHGGIVAFAGGGDVERYQSGGLKPGQVTDGQYVYETPYDRMNRLNREREEREYQERVARVIAEGGNVMPYGEQMSNVGGALLSVPVTAFKHLVSAPGYGFNRASAEPVNPAAVAQAAAQAAGANAAPAVPPVPPAAAAAPAGIAGLGAGLKAERPQFKPPEGESYAAMAERFFTPYAEGAKARDAAADAAKAEARSKVKGTAFEGYEKELQKEAEETGGDKDQAKYMSLLKAGLAMMGGTSRHAMENIGKGAMVGAEDYQSAMKDLKRAEKERRKEMAHIEAARRAEAVGDRDTAIREADAARDRGDARERFTLDARYKATGMDKAQTFEGSKLQFASDSDLAKTDLAGRYSLAGAQARANAVAAGGGRGAMTANQLAHLRLKAMEAVTPEAMRAQVAKQLGFKKAPDPKVDAKFDAEVAKAYDNAINEFISRALGQMAAPGGAGQYQGFRIVPEE